MGWQCKRDSCFKCLIYFADGVPRTFYSLDWVGPLSKSRDPDLGLKRLRALIQKHGIKAITSIIYDNVTKQRLEQYNKGIRTF